MFLLCIIYLVGVPIAAIWHAPRFAQGCMPYPKDKEWEKEWRGFIWLCATLFWPGLAMVIALCGIGKRLR